MKVGLQLFSVKEAMKEDPKGTLKKIAELGYRYIEPYCFPVQGDETSFGLHMPLAEAKAFLEEIGLQVVGAHYYPLGSDAFEEFCRYYIALGVKQVGSGGAHFPGGVPDVMEKVALMQKDAEKADALGLKYYYHNHYREYQTFDGVSIIDMILNNTTALVHYEIDLFWAARGGVDPVAELERCKDRLIPLVHQKDFSKTARVPLNIWEYLRNDFPISSDFDQTTRLQELYCEVGDGLLPIQDYIDKANELGVEYTLLEQDKTSIGEINSITRSMEAFHKFSGIEWD